MLITLTGKVQAVDDSAYRLPPSDTLAYLVSSMLSFVDTLPRYRIRVIDKYVTVPRPQLHPLLCGRHPGGGYAGRQWPRAGEDLRPDAPDHRAGGVLRRYDHHHGLLLSGGALRLQRAPLAGACRGAETLPGPSLRPGYRHAADRAVGRRGVARADEPHPHGPCADEPRGDAGAPLRGAGSGPAGAAAARALPREYAYLKEVIYPQLRTVDFRYNLRRKGMVKDTIHTTELDTTYARGVELLQRRQYARALYILNDYNDRNTVVAHLSMDHNERALELALDDADGCRDGVPACHRLFAAGPQGRRARALPRSLPPG